MPVSPLDRADLLARWLSIVGDRPSARAQGESLLDRWAEPHRSYHDLAHLAAVLDHLDALVRAEPGTSSDADAVRLAAFFHDAVYDPTRVDNEDRSAALADDVLDQLGVPEARVSEVGRLVRLTATHAAGSEDGDGALLCDADLAVLAGDPEAYAAYAAAVREEYAHVPEPLFKAGRSAVLERLLADGAVYRTRTGRSWWESTARRNVEAELVLLRAQSAGADEPGASQPPGAG